MRIIVILLIALAAPVVEAQAQAASHHVGERAKVLGESDRLGSLAVGKLADLVMIKGNPAANPGEIRNVTIVFKHGVGYDSAKVIESVKGIVGVR